MPTFDPTRRPTIFYSIIPSSVPSLVPTLMPTVAPSVLPSAPPTSLPSAIPTLPPTLTPSTTPSTLPSATPTEYPSESASGINVGLLSAVAAAGAGAAAAGGSGAAASAGSNMDQQMIVAKEDDGGENAFYSEDFEGGGEEEEMVEVEAEEDDNRRNRRASRRSLMGPMSDNAGGNGQNVSLAVAGAALANAGNVNLQRDQNVKQDSKWVSDDDGDGSTHRGDQIHSFRQNFLSPKSNRSLFDSTEEEDNYGFVDDGSSISSVPQYFAPPQPIMYSDNRMFASNSQPSAGHNGNGLLQQMSARSLLSSNAGGSEFREEELQRSLFSLSKHSTRAGVPPASFSYGPPYSPQSQQHQYPYYGSSGSNSVTDSLRSSIQKLGRNRRSPTIQESLKNFGTGRLRSSMNSMLSQPPPPQYHQSHPSPPVGHVMVNGYLVNGSFVPAGQVYNSSNRTSQASVRDIQRDAIRRHFAGESDGLRRSRSSRSFRENRFGGSDSSRRRRYNPEDDDKDYSMGYGISG